MSTAYVVVELDTQPPVLSLVGPGTVEPPDDITITVTSSEDVGWVDLRFVDSVGQQHDLGARRVDARTLLVTIPTSLMSTGMGTLWATVADTVCNVAVSTKTVLVGTTKSFEAVLEFENAYDVDEGLYRGYDVMIVMSKEAPRA